ncbi:MAG: hypothetical protein R3F49_05295 [Planctomycetota bacterium]
MLKHVATINLALAGVFVLPSVAGTQDGSQGLVAQLDATVSSLDYLSEIVKRLESGDRNAIQLLLGATEPARQNELQSEARLVSLRGEVSRLRLALDRLMGGADASARILGGADSRDDVGASRSPGAPRGATTPDWSGGTLSPTVGLDRGMASNLKSVLPPLEHVDSSAKRRGGEPVTLEDGDFTADAVRQGKLLFRAQRYPESIQLLLPMKQDHEARYWLAQAYRAMDLVPEALEILRMLAENEDAGAFSRYAKADLDFIEFEREIKSRKAKPEGKGK